MWCIMWLSGHFFILFFNQQFITWSTRAGHSSYIITTYKTTELHERRKEIKEIKKNKKEIRKREEGKEKQECTAKDTIMTR